MDGPRQPLRCSVSRCRARGLQNSRVSASSPCPSQRWPDSEADGRPGLASKAPEVALSVKRPRLDCDIVWARHGHTAISQEAAAISERVAARRPSSGSTSIDAENLMKTSTVKGIAPLSSFETAA